MTSSPLPDPPVHATRIEVLDPDLPMLASQAALELDNKHLGQHVEPVATKLLAEALKNSFAPFEANASARKSLVDPGAVAVIGRALYASQWVNAGSTVDELSDTAWNLAHIMDQLENGQIAENVEKVRDFCIELSSYAASYRQAFSDPGPVPPYRR